MWEINTHEIKKFSRWPLVLIPGGGIALMAWLIYKNWGPGAVMKDSNGTPVDFNSDATRSLRAKNPLSLSSSDVATKWGSVSEDNELNDHLAIFPDVQSGLSAAAQELLYSTHYFGGGNNTPDGIGTTWANDASYGLDIASNMGLEPGTVLSFQESGVSLMKAIAREENGLVFVVSIPDEMYQTAVNNALNNRR